jgi:UDP-3-O-acyl-N-acetylglucosamine deacetylase
MKVRTRNPALYALEIDNCVIEIDRTELPGLDGSAAAYVDALRSAGLVMQAKSRRQLVVDRPLRVGNEQAWVEALPATDGRMHVEYRLDYGGDSPIRPQTFSSEVSPEAFCRDIAPARTFVTKQQAEQLRTAGVAKHVTNRDLLGFGDSGPVDNLLRYSDECARHKALDMIGDLSVVGVELVGRFVSYRGGHQLNGLMAERLCAAAESVPAGCRNVA